MFDIIKRVFMKTGSIEETVAKTGINEYKVRRALITMELWESRRSREILDLKKLGLSTGEIAERLALSVKGVESYLPYTRGAYMETMTDSARDSKNYRERMKSTTKRQVAVHSKKYQGGQRKMNSNDLDGLKVYKLMLQLEIDEENLPVLRQYGKVKNGVTRTILVPSTMQLNRLNYAIQKCFGWENSHLHHFELREETFDQIVKGNLEGWKELAGVYFRCYDITAENDDLYYLDDYDGRYSFKTWLKRKYSGSYVYNPQSENRETIREKASSIVLRENTFWADLEKNHPEQVIRKKTKVDDLHFTLVSYGGMELLEKLTIRDILQLENCFFYEYDYGDGWRVKIMLLDTYGNRHATTRLSASGSETAWLDENRSEHVDPDVEGKLRESVGLVMEKLAPICLEADGLPVFDDVGGPYGYCAFLLGLHGRMNDREFEPEDMEWARSLGWNGRMNKPEKIL